MKIFRDCSVARFVAILLLITLATGCASNPQPTSTTETAPDSDKNRDPFEKVNRATFAFNDKVDQWMLKPVVKGYMKVTPDPVESGVSNFFDNLGEIQNVVNDVLQWKWKQAGNDSGRFLINSTVGLAGFFDVAKSAGLPQSEGEDFGQTFSVWGVPQGPYLVVPFLGPFTLAEAAGAPLDWQLNPVTHIDHDRTRYSLVAARIIDARAGVMDVEELISGDRYSFVRDAYLQRRDFVVNDGKVEDDFGGDFSEDGEFDF